MCLAAESSGLVLMWQHAAEAMLGAWKGVPYAERLC